MKRYTFVLTALLPDDLTEEQIDFLAGTMQVQLDEPMIGAPEGSWENEETSSENVRMDVFNDVEWELVVDSANIGLEGAPATEMYTQELLDNTWTKLHALVVPPLPPKSS